MIRLIQRRLIIPRGDTGTFTVSVISAKNTGDVAVFSIIDNLTERKVFEKIVEVSGDTMTIEFSHNDTVNLPVGKYVWDIKFYSNPVFVDGALIDGVEVDSYYAAFTLPICEIRQTGDNLLMADDAPDTELTPSQLNILNATVNETNAAKRDAAASANAAKASATAAASNASEALISASNAADSATSAAASAADAITTKNQVAVDATTAVNAKNDAIANATSANTSATAADASATTASNAATTATNKANEAYTSAGLAETAKVDAQSAASTASTSAASAQAAANEIKNISAEATTLQPDSNATATYNSSTGKLIFGIPRGNGITSAVMNNDYTLTLTYTNGNTFTTPPLKGEQGDAFHIVKTYNSVAAMNADYNGNDVEVGEFVMIASTVEDPDNAKVYIKGDQQYNFVIDMSGASGINGVGISSIQKTSASGKIDTYTITYTDNTTSTFTVTNGDNGEDGISPIASISKFGNTSTITITDKNGTTTTQVIDGADGTNGTTFTPFVSSEGVISWTNDGNKQNPSPTNIKGPAGINGTNGSDGISPTVTITDIVGGHRVTITDAEHPNGQIFDVMDGAEGQTGADGVSPTASVSRSGSTATVTIMDKNGTTTAQVTDGADGTTFTPSVAANGDLSWSNADGKPNPATVNIRGPASTDEQVVTAVAAWLDDHPEATTTVLDGAITKQKLDANLQDTVNDVDDLRSNIAELAINGYYYSVSPETYYIATENGQIMNNSSLPVTSPVSQGNRGYHWFTAQEIAQTIEIDTAKYAYNLAYSNNGTKTGYTSWLSTSPIAFDSSITYTQIGINIKLTTDAALSVDDFAKALHYTTAESVVGDLAPKSFVVPKQQSVVDAGKFLTIGNNGIVGPSAFPLDNTLTLSGKAADAKEVGNRIFEIANHGYYEVASQDVSITTALGMVNNQSPVTIVQRVAKDTSYAKLTGPLLTHNLYFDSSKYQCNLAYFKNNVVVQFDSWQVVSPISVDTTINADEVYINVRKLSGSMSESDFASCVYYKAGNYVGNLATKDYVDNWAQIAKGRKCIYPDGFISRIKPDVFYNGRYSADINTKDYKISGSGEVWVATDGSDSAEGTREAPFLTIDHALEEATTIHIKTGTYEQGTHYDAHVDFAGKNIIGHGTVILQNNANGNYPSVSSSAYIENITVKHGNATTNQAFYATCSASGKTVCFVGCTFRDGGGNGLSVTGIDAVLVDCVTYGNKLDGFNYHDKTVSEVTYIPNVIEIDCVAYGNGSDQSGSDSCNGSTAHDGTKIIRLNGEYYSCYGGVIAEIARAGEEPTISVNYGVLAHESTGTGTYKASFWASVNTKMYLYDCKSYGGDYDISAINDSKIVSWRLTTGRDEPSVNKETNATVIQH